MRRSRSKPVWGAGGGIKSILLIPPSSITLPTNTLEVHTPRLPSVITARGKWAGAFTGFSSLGALPSMRETFSTGLGEPPFGCSPPLPSYAKGRRMNKLEGKS